MKGIFSDWQAKGITSVLHEKRGGYANNMASMQGLAQKAEREGVRIQTHVKVTGFQFVGERIAAVETDQGMIQTDYVVVGVGPWIKEAWEMMDLPNAIDVKIDGALRHDIPMWTYWCLQEGTLGVDPNMQKTNAGDMPPVIHLDSAAPLYSGIDGTLITDKMWGIYYKPDFAFNGIQGGAAPYEVQRADVRVDPYGPASPDFVVGEDFANMWCSALAFCQKRFEGKHDLYNSEEPSGGLGAFSPDSFPVFDIFHQNCYIIADSNHGYKMIGVGKLVADEILGEKKALLEPFRFSRYAAGKLHPVSNSPFPWS